MAVAIRNARRFADRRLGMIGCGDRSPRHRDHRRRGLARHRVGVCVHRSRASPGRGGGCVCSCTMRRRGAATGSAMCRRVEVVVGDISVRADVDRLFAGLTGTVDVIHTAGVIHPTTMAEFEAVNHVGTDNVLAAAAAASSPPHGPRVVEQPVRHQPGTARHVPQRRAVPPVPRLRHLEDERGTARRRSCRARPRRRDRAPALVLRPPPAGPPDDVLHARSHGPLPRARRRWTASVDGLHRQSRAGHRARRADPDRSRARLVDRRRACLHGRRDRRDRRTCAHRRRVHGRQEEPRPTPPVRR